MRSSFKWHSQFILQLKQNKMKIKSINEVFNDADEGWNNAKKNDPILCTDENKTIFVLSWVMHAYSILTEMIKNNNKQYQNEQKESNNN